MGSQASTGEPSPRPLRKATLSSSLWLFSVFTTLLLIGLWGRSVASDQVTLEESTRAVLESELIHGRVQAWISDAFTAARDTGQGDAARLVDRLAESPELNAVVTELIDAAVDAALAPPGEGSAIDVEAVLAPILPMAREELSTSGAGES